MPSQANLLAFGTLAFTLSAYGQATFSPAGGTYSSPVTVTINCPGGHSCFYTVDGSTPSIASTQYTAPLLISSNSTLNVISVQTGVSYQNVGASSAHWKCTTASGGTWGGLTCQSGGGVGSNNPSNVTWTFGAPMSETVSTTHASGETQALFINTQSTSACPNCTMLAEDKIVQPTQGSSFVANEEMDANINMLATWNQFHTASLQCNQQAGHQQWQIDNQQGSWINTGITYGCPLSTTQQTEIRYTIHWANGDHSCTGGFSTDHYDTLTVCVGGTNGVGGACRDFTINKTLCGYTEPGWSQSVVIQDQIDLTNTTQSGHNPTTSTRKVWRDNVTTAYFGTTATASATYTFGSTPTPPATFHGAVTLQGQIPAIR